jgi:pentatricopeptide repeat protein
MLEGLVRAGDLDGASTFFARIESPNVVSWVTLLAGYCRAGRIGDARELFDRMPERNIVAWNAMLEGYVCLSRMEEACKLFEEMPDKNSISWTTIISGLARAGKLQEAKDLLDKMPFNCVAAKTALMRGYLQRKMVGEARQIFDGIEARDTVCWNTMLSGYVQCGMMEAARLLFQRMPNMDTVSWNTMIAGYAQGGQMRKAVGIFKKMNRRDTVSWNTVISGFVQNGLFVDALHHFMLMRRDTKRADWSTYASCLSACANLSALQVGRQFHTLLVRSGHINDSFAGNALISTYAKCGRILEAKLIFDEMAVKDIVSWNALIDGYALNGHGTEAISVFLEMEANNIRPDEVTLVGILSACSRAGLIDEGLKYFNSMEKDYSLKPVAEHYACMADMLGRAGRLEEAFELVQGMQIQPNAGVWGALLGACRLHKNDELAKLAAEKLFDLEPRKTSNYVLLSNINAEAGKWDEAEKARASIKEKGVHKPPGLAGSA